MPAKFLYQVIDKRAGALAETLPLLSVSISRGVIRRDELTEKPARADDLLNYKLCTDRDIVINRMSAYQGALGISPMDGFVSPDYLVLRARPETEPRFLTYVFRSTRFVGDMTARLRGIGSTDQGNVRTPRINEDELGRIMVSIPAPVAQRAIADYLDRETARIDALIAAKQRMVELLGERRAATIARMVTPEANATDWRRLRLRHVLLRMIDTEHKTAPFYDNGEFLVIRTNNVSRGRLIVGPGSKFTDAAGHRVWTQRGRPEPGDILFTREAPAGEACLVPDGLNGCVGQRTVLFKPDETRVLARYCLWALYGGIARSFIAELSQGSTVAHLNMSDIPDIPLWVPDIATQRMIANRLDEATSTIDEIVGVIKRQGELLGEHRQALITAAVTGQVDVPEAA